MGNAILKFVVALCALAAAIVSGLAAAQAPKPGAEPLGRLFFTPAQRAQLDVARKQRARTALATETTEEATAAPTPQTITYDGVVQRSDGKSTVWINSRPAHEKESASGGVIVGRVRANGGVSLQIPQSGRTVNLKPGQSVELLSGAIEERFTRKPSAPEPKPAVKPGAELGTNAKPAAKPAAPERAVEGRNREEREQRRAEEVVSRALQESGDAKPGVVPPVERPR
jgi:hypothetical protein